MGQKLNLKQYVFLIFVIFNSNLFAQHWPTTGIINDGVGLSFGSYQFVSSLTGGGLDRSFHTGIDIAGEHGVVHLKAIGSGNVVRVIRSSFGDQVAYYFQLDANPGDIVIYGHCMHPGLSYVNQLPIHYNSGNTFGDIQDYNLAHSSYDHCHFTYLNSQNIFDYPSKSVNPLLQQFALSTGQDPGNSDCIFEDLIIRPKTMKMPITVKDNNSFNCLSKPFIWNKVKLVKEIRDNMNSGIGSIIPEFSSNAWCGSGSSNTTFRIGDRGVPAPNRVGFQILSNISIPLTNILWYNTPINPSSNFDMALIYDNLFLNNGAGPNLNIDGGITLKYNLTNITGNGSNVQDRFWNTRVRQGNNYYDHVDANFIDEALFPDNNYIIRSFADDLPSSANPVHDDDMALIDNFKPYVKKVEIKEYDNSTFISNLYKSEWQLITNVLKINPQFSSSRYLNDYVRSASKRIQIEITYSEPMKSSGMSLGLFSECQGHHSSASAISLIDVAVDSKTFTFSIDNIDLDPHAEVQDLVIYAVDLAGNELMGFSEANTQLNVDKVAVRDVDGNWINDFYTGNKDLMHHFKIKGCFFNYRNGGPNLPDGPMSTNCMIVDFSASNTNVQINVPVSFTNLSIVPDVANTTWEWTFSDNSPMDNSFEPTHSFSVPGDYTITLFATDQSSSDRVDRTITNYIHVGGINSSGTSVEIVCSDFDLIIDQGNSVSFSPDFSNPPLTASYFWEFPGGSPSTSIDPFPNVYYSSDGNYIVHLTVIDGNGSNIIANPVNIIVNSFIFPVYIQCPQLVSVCNAGIPTSFTAHAWGGVPPYTFNWDFGDGIIDQGIGGNTDHTFLSPGTTYNVSVTVFDAMNSTNNCNFSISTIASSGLQGGFTATPSASNTHPVTVTFTPFFTTQCGHLITYDWDFGDGVSTSTYLGYPDVSHTFSFPGTFVCTLKISDDCAGEISYTQNITVGGSTAQFEPYISIYPFTNCNGSNPYFSAGASGGSGNYHYGWSVLTPGYQQSNPNTPNDHFLSHTGTDETEIFKQNLFPQPNYPYTFDLRCQISDGVNGWGEIINSLTLYGDLNIQLDDIKICPGGSIVLEPIITGGTGKYNYFWNATNGSFSSTTASKPIYKLSAGTQDDITLYITDSRYYCPLVEKIIHVTADQLSVTIDELNICRDAHVQINPIITGGSGNLIYDWTPAINLSCTDCPNPIISPIQNGTFLYTLKISDQTGCGASTPFTVNVSNDHPFVNPIEDAFTCPGKEVLLVGNANGGSGIYSFQWVEAYRTSNVLSNNITLTQGPFQSTLYNIIVTDQNGCTASQSAFIFVNEEIAPVANAGLDREACTVITDLLASASGGNSPYSYLWLAPDGSISSNNPLSVSNPNNSATYDLIVTDNNGCKGKDFITLTHRSLDNLILNTANLPAFVCIGSSVTLFNPNNLPIVDGNALTPPYSYEWTPSTFLDDYTKENPICTPTDEQQVTYCLKVTDSRGCVVRNSNTNFGAAFIIPYKQLRNPELVFSTDNACLVDDFCFDAIPNIEIDNTILTSQSSILIKPYCDGSFYPLSIQNSPYNDVAFIPQPDRITRTNNHYCVGYNSIGTKYITYDGFSNDSYFHPCNSFSNTYEITVNYHDETDAQDIVYGQLSGNRNQTSLEIFSPYPPTTCTLSTPSCYTFLIDASSVVDFTARDQIVLFPGFEIEEGGNLIAKINPCLVDNNSIQIHSENGNYPYSSNQSTLKIHQKDEEMNFSKFEVYPNPTNNIININITIDKEYKNELFLTNNLGELLKVFVLSNAEEIEVQINLIGLDVKPGIYFLTLRTPKLVSTKKIVYIN